MANDPRSSGKSKDDEIDSSRKKPVVGKGSSTSGSAKAETSALRRSARETPPKVPMSSTPLTSRKSERLEKKPITPSKRKLELVEKQNTVSPLRRSDRAKKQHSSSSSGSKKSDGSGLPDDRGNSLTKEKSGKQLEQEAQEISKSKKHPKTNVVKKRMDARTYKSLFKKQRNRALQLGEESCDGTTVSKQGREDDEIHEVTESRRGELVEEDIYENCGAAFKSSHILERSSNAEELENNTNAEELEASCSSEKLNDNNLRTSSTAESLGKTHSDEKECAPTTVSKDIGVSDTDTSAPVSSRRKSYDYVTACVTCNKRQRVDYNSVQQELCICGSTMEKHLQRISSSKDRSDNQSSARDLVDEDECNAGTESPSDVKCVVCKLDGKLLRCGGKGCMRSFHISCLDPSLDDALPGQFHCNMCAKKKIESGVYSVTKGIESIWNTREVEVRDAEGSRKQKQYFVKYRGLSHVYNHWIPEAILLLEAPNTVSEFNGNKQVTEWREDWMVPQRLLMGRSLRCSVYQNDSNNDHHGDIDCHYEWLVKWRGLDHEHATWEMENADFLCSSQGRKLMEEFLSRRERAKKAASVSTADKSKVSLVKPTELLSNVFDYDHVNKLHEYWHKGENAIVINDQERIAKVILFISSLVTDACQPFLVITSSSALSRWEAEFARLAPSADVVVYSGNEDNRKIIRACELYDEKGCVMLQVLLSSVEAIVKDLDDLECLRWEAIVVDECQDPGVSKFFELIKRLTSDVRVLLLNDQLKDSNAEYLNLLLLLDTPSNLDCGSASRLPLKVDRRKLSERLSHFIAYDCSSDSSRFLEYWVPVLISDVQLEQYCAALLTNYTCLRSHLKNDLVGALHDILISIRKCCDHPFMLDGSLQKLMLKDRAPADYLDVGIKASGKLELLDKILSEMKNRGLRAVIIFQPIGDSGRDTMGDILDDFVRQRFGVDSYERLDGGYLPAKKRQVAIDKFNDKDSGRFVLLLENRACQGSVKLSSVDAIIIYDSDWNPINDSRALHKLSISPSSRKIKVFRLYTSCTIEERVLELNTYNVTLDSRLHGVCPSTSHKLLMWGASYLFGKLDEFHSDDTSSPASSRTSSELSVLNDVGKEFLALLCQEGENVYTDNSLIVKVRQAGTKYSKTASLFGERKAQLVDKEDPRSFWTNLLERKNPRWRYPSGLSQRNRKRVKNSDDSPNKPDADTEESRKKKMKLVNNSADPASRRPSSSEDNLIGSKEGDSEVRVSNGLQYMPRSSAGVTQTVHASTSYLNSNGISSLPETDTSNPLGRPVLRDVQVNLLELLKPEISKICEILNLPQDVKVMLGRFLEFVVDNHHISREPVSIFQAFQISVCWIAASLRKSKLDKKESFALVKQNLNFACNEEEAHNVYTKLRLLKRPFLGHLENLKESESSKDSVSLADDSLMEQLDARKLPSLPHTIKVEVEERTENQDIGDDGLLQQQVLKQAGKAEARMTKVMQKQQEELQVFQRTWDMERKKLESDEALEVYVVQSVFRNMSVQADKLKKVKDTFSKKRDELETRKLLCLKDLQARQLTERREERQKPAPYSEAMQAGVVAMVQPDIPVAAANEASIGPATIVTPTMSLDRNCETDNTHLPTILLAGSENVSNLPSSSSAPRKSSSGNLLPSANQDSDAASLRAKEFPESSLKEVVNGSDPIGVVNPDFESNKELNHQDDVVIGSSTNTVCVENPLPQSPLMQPTVTSAEADTVPQIVDECLSSRATGVRDEEEPAGENQDVLQEGEGQSLSPTISEQADQTHQEAVVIQPEDRPASGTQNTPQQVEHQASHPVVILPAGGNQNVLQEGEGQSLSPALSERADQTNDEAVVIEHEDRPASETQNIPQQVENPVDPTPTEQTNHDPQTIQSEDTSNFTIPPADVHASHDQPGDVELAVGSSSQPSNGGYTPFQNAEGSSQLVENTDRLAEHQSNILPPIRVNDVGSVPSPDMALGDGIENQLDSEECTSFLPDRGILGTQLLAEDLARLPNQGILGTQLGMNLPLQTARQAAPRMAAQPVYGDPLQNELERIRKETDHVAKIHKDSKMQVQSECDKEIEIVVAEIRRKYDAKLQAAEAAFVLKKKELDTNHERVLLNKILAEAFRSKFLDIRPSGGLGIQQAMPSSLMQQMHHLSSSHTPPGRPSMPGTASASHATNPAGHQTAGSTPTHHYPPPHASTLPNRSLHGGSPANLPSGTPSGNRQLTSEIRAPAPHLQQRFRPSPPMSAAGSSPQPRTLPSQHMNLPSHHMQQSFPGRPVGPAVPHRTPHPNMAPRSGNQTKLSSVENHRTVMPNNSSFPAELVANLGSLNLTQFGAPDTSNHNAAFPGGSAADIVCLSDDE